MVSKNVIIVYRINAACQEQIGLDVYLFSLYSKRHEKEEKRPSAKGGRRATQREPVSARRRQRKASFQGCGEVGRDSLIGLGKRAVTPSSLTGAKIGITTRCVPPSLDPRLIVLTDADLGSMLRPQTRPVN